MYSMKIYNPYVGWQFDTQTKNLEWLQEYALEMRDILKTYIKIVDETNQTKMILSKVCGARPIFK